MVREIDKRKKKYFQCESCNFYYLNSEIAKKCEDFCNKHKSCNIEITKHAVKFK